MFKFNCKEQNTRSEGLMACHLPSTSRDSLGIPWVSYSIGRATIFMHGIYPCSLVAQVGNHDIKVEIRAGPKNKHINRSNRCPQHTP